MDNFLKGFIDNSAASTCLTSSKTDVGHKSTERLKTAKWRRVATTDFEIETKEGCPYLLDIHYILRTFAT